MSEHKTINMECRYLTTLNIEYGYDTDGIRDTIFIQQGKQRVLIEKTEIKELIKSLQQIAREVKA